MEVVNKVYEYRPLVENGAIRLILLEPSSDPTAGMKCSLLHTTLVELDEEVLYHYCTLSYVWGNIEDTVPISVDEKELNIGRNLASHSAIYGMQLYHAIYGQMRYVSIRAMTRRNRFR